MLVVIIFFVLALVIFFAFLLFAAQKSEVLQVYKGVCPDCGAKNSEEEEVVKSKILSSSGCSGVADVEYRCSHCNYSIIVKTSNAQACRM